jgi:Fe-S oxidoreductase
MNLLEYYEEVNEKIKHECIECGNCISRCRAMEYLPDKPDPRETQRNITAFLRGDEGPSAPALLKMQSCMRCYGCLDVPCPIKVNSLQINELIGREMHRRGKLSWDGPPSPVHDELARKNSTAEEYRRITAAVADRDAEYLFFPGCNIYKQPDKLLNALTVLDAIGEAYSFVPGMEYCCGSSPRGMNGDVERMQSDAEKLFAFAAKLHVKKMIFWCPTCLSMLHDRIMRFYRPSFECVSFAGYVLEHIDRLRFPAAAPRKVTYHEPCKNAYMGIDPDSVRKVLRAIPGTETVEMDHYGKDALCCGCCAVVTRPEAGDRATVARLLEAEATGADTLITLCHNCHWIFMPAKKAHRELRLTYSIENFATYLVNAMGMPRPDSLL